MSENRKYYYMKLKENFFTDAKMVILESMQDGLLYSNLLLKMYLMSLKYNGILMLNDHLPHTPQTIATFTRHQIGTVERAIKVFLEFGFVEILTDGSYYMADIQLLIGQSSTEGERKRKERMRLKRQNLLPSGQVDKCPPEIRDKRLDIRDKENRECVGTPAYGRYQNVFLTDDELTELQKELPVLWQTYVDSPSTWRPPVSSIKTTRLLFAAGQPRIERKQQHRPETEITAFEKVKPYDGNHRGNPRLD